MTHLIALLTGSSRGIGAAIAQALRARGVKVIGQANRAVDSSTIAADLTNPAAPAAIWEEAMTRAEGRIDLLVNNAGHGIFSFAICPDFTDTTIARDYLTSRGGAALLADIPLGRVAQREEIATIAAFCALDATESMTGAVLDANGASYVR